MKKFKIGDRVRDNQRQWPSFGETGVVIGEAGARYWRVEYDRTGDHGLYRESELDKLPADRRLTIRPTKATTAASFDGGIDVIGPHSLSADAVIIEGDFEFEVEEIDPNTYVQVDYSGSSTGRYQPLYTYIDPTGGNLRVGDLVEVPVTYGTKVARVAELGRGSYNGECKTVAAHLIREALV